jgi:hypothetical protein
MGFYKLQQKISGAMEGACGDKFGLQKRRKQPERYAKGQIKSEVRYTPKSKLPNLLTIVLGQTQ